MCSKPSVSDGLSSPSSSSTAGPSALSVVESCGQRRGIVFVRNPVDSSLSLSLQRSSLVRDRRDDLDRPTLTL